MTAVAIIPARLGSTRFPEKVLAAATGRPLVQHVVDQVRGCSRVREVIVAADDPRIPAALAPFGTRCVLTDPAHASGTDRIAEVASGLSDAIVVNVQGDEPEIEPQTVDALVEAVESGEDDLSTAAAPFPPDADVDDPNLVKVVCGLDGRALYFSRSPIPRRRDESQPRPGYLLHVGVYAYRRSFLLRFAEWAPTPLERTEKLEQLRALEHGGSIRVVRVERTTHGIDTPEQYEEFVRRFRSQQARSQRRASAKELS